MARGKVYLVGGGPGDPGLLTLRARDVLSKADAVIYDALIHPAILGFIPESAKRIFRGHRSQRGALSQAQIIRLMVQLAKQGKQIVRLKGGDPFVFGRGAEEALELRKQGVPFEIVPGVTSAVAVPAYAGIPVTHRDLNSSFTVATGHEDPGKPDALVDWRGLARNEGTLVFLMGLHALPGLCRRLIAEGKAGSTPAAVIESGTTSRQRAVVGTLATVSGLVKKAGLKPPATVVVGKVVRLAGRLRWFKPGPLQGLRVLVTRTRSQASQLSGLLAEKGAEVIEIPTLEIVPRPLTAEAERLIRDAGAYDWVVFTSANGVEIFMDRLFELGRDARALKGAKIACVGEATAESLRRSGVRADLVPTDYKQEGLVQAFSSVELEGKKILLPRPKEGRDLLLNWLRGHKAKVDDFVLYESRPPKGSAQRLRRLFAEEGGVDLLTFAASSAADNFYKLFNPSQRRKWLKKLPVAVIGPVTAKTIRSWGGRVTMQALPYTIPSLVAGIGKWARKRKKV